MTSLLSLNKAKVLFLVVALVAELEYLLVTNYPIRTEIRALVGVPIYHVLLTLFALATLVRWIAPQAQRPPVGVRISFPWAIFHLALYALVLSRLDSLWSVSLSFSAPARLAFWGALGLVVLASWLRIWLPFHRWKDLWRLEGEWLRWALPLSFLAPYVAEFASSWWRGFARLTFELTDFCLGFIYSDAVADPPQLLLGTTRFVVEIQPGCSGYEGMGLIAVLMVGYLWLKRSALQMPEALLVIPISMALAYVANIVRLVLLVMIGTNLSASVAMRGFHSQAGWISFTILSMVLIGVLEKKQLLLRPDRQTAPEVVRYEYLVTPYLAPLIGLLFASMLVQAFSSSFPTFYPVKPLLAGAVLLYFLPKLRREWVRPNFALATAVGIGVYALWVALVRTEESPSPYDSLPAEWVVVWILFRCLGSIVVVPVVEEVAFRGYLLRRLQAREFEIVEPSRFSVTATVVSSIFFGLLHADWLAGFLAGVAYAWVSTRAGYLSNAVMAHAITNGCISAQVLWLGTWGLW